MNQRIRQLASDAGLLFQRDKLSYEELKFAELMVQDCIRILHSNGYDDAAKCLQDIHFGIENPV